MKTIFNLSLLTLLLSSVFYFFAYPGVDNDLWGHLFFGKEILQSGKLPFENLYSYTAPHHGWINHEWLAEVIFYGLFHLFGSAGLILFKLALGGGVIWILDLTIRRQIGSPFVRVLALVWTMAILSPGFNLRPQIFTYLFFTALLFLFYRYENGRKNALYWIPLLTVFWVNLHGGFVAGLAALALFSFWTAIRGLRSGNTTKLAVTRVLVPLIFSVLTLGLNPHGLDLLSFLAKDLLLDRPISEWSAIPLLDVFFLEFKLAVVFVLLFSLRRETWHRWDFVLTVLAGIFAFRYQRHSPLFAITAAPFLARGVQQVYLWMRSRVRERLLGTLLLAIALYQFLWIAKIHWRHRLQLVVSPQEYPTQAADFLLRNQIRGNLAVPFDWGEYLIWKLYPEIRVSIDGRYTTAYPIEVIEDSWEWMGGGEGWRRSLERYPTDIAITNRHHPITALMRKDPEWVYIYSDPLAFIFVRKTPSQEPLLSRFKEKGLLPPPAPLTYFPG